jgi:hypothetical protein
VVVLVVMMIMIMMTVPFVHFRGALLPRHVVHREAQG